MADDPKKDFNADALLEGHGRDITALGDKIGRCFSMDRYDEFQKAVKNITLETLDSGDGRKKVKEYSVEAVKDHNREVNWDKVKFWVPTVISIIAIIVAGYFALSDQTEQAPETPIPPITPTDITANVSNVRR